MEDNNFDSNTQNVGTYRATTNLNTAIENPQVSINNAVDVNIQSVSDSSFNNNVQNSFVPNNGIQSNDSVNQQSNNHVNQQSNNYVNQQSDNFIPLNQESDTDIQVNDSYLDADKIDNEDNIVPTGNVSYTPVGEKKNRKSFDFAISKELKLMAFVAFLLLIFVLAIPSIYDFFKKLGLVISG